MRPNAIANDAAWTADEYYGISQALQETGCRYVTGRDEYVLLKEAVKGTEDHRNGYRETPQNEYRKSTEVSKYGTFENPENPYKLSTFRGGVNSPIGDAKRKNYTYTISTPRKPPENTPFLAPLDIQESGSIADVLPLFK
ncbi:MAG: hypothetical protein LUG27_05475 [Clostridiales bacterium]|nr:hypothetical protein [Clostridiales bacterium]